MNKLTIGLATSMLAFAVGVGITLLWPFACNGSGACEQARIEAARDIRLGKLGNRYCGRAGEVSQPYRTLEMMESKYGIHSEWVGECLGEGEPGTKAYCYNVIMWDEFDRRYGRGTRERFIEMARKEFNWGKK
jgi:hypothetical protein